MITIIIKSFNRPFYLDRCLQSIKQNVRGNYNIIIIDDGTPEKFLKKIESKYSLEILKTNNYNLKSKNIENGLPNNGFEIPTNAWRDAVIKASDYFLITEDDVWFTDSIDIEDIVTQMKKNNIFLTKLGVLGNYTEDKYADIKSISDNLEYIYPTNIFATTNKFLMDLYIFNKYKFYSLLFKLGIVNNETKKKYWLLNSILMGVYNKEYWLFMWKDSINKVDEKLQLRNAAIFFAKNRNNKYFVTRTKKEVMKTTFKSSSTDSYHKYDVAISMDTVNQILNLAWLNDNLDVMENYPKDFSNEYILSFLEEADNDKAKPSDWLKWVEKFKNQYRINGADVD